MEMAKVSVNSGRCMQEDKNLNKMGIKWFIIQGKETMEKPGTKNGENGT